MGYYSKQIEDYEFGEQLGKGGFATVFKARCLTNYQDVAIKMIDKTLATEKQMWNRVCEEVQIHSILNHSSILELYTHIEDSEYVYLVLELAHNGTLHKYFSDKTPNEFEAATILTQVVDGVKYLHSKNIMHRDLSMSNLLLTASMHVKIADFGLATRLNDYMGNKHTTLCGTPNYISPEVASRSDHGLATDIWGLGCLLYTLVVGRPPFDTNAVKATLTQVVIRDYDPIPGHISPEACDLIKKMLCKIPHERIRLDEIDDHPFIKRHCQVNRMIPIDSGIATLSSSSKTTRSRSEERSLKQHNRITGISVSSASLYRGTSQMNINQQHQINSYHSYQRSIAQYNSPQQVIKVIEVPPLSTIRLQPTRHKTKSVILSIIEDPIGEVVLEFLKYKSKYGEERIFDVCRISSDGLRIVLYQPNNGKGVKIQDRPPELPTIGADQIYSYENLPEKHWRKYMYAHRFIQMVRAKTPKITFYSNLAKCQLMETLEDFEMFLYKGGKVTKNVSSSDFQLQLESNSKIFTREQEIVQHAHQCFQHCLKVEETMSLMSLEFPCFPIIIGRRPAEQESPKEIYTNNTFNNYISSSQTPLRTPNINMPSFSIDHTPSPPVKHTPLGLHNPRIIAQETSPLNVQEKTVIIPGVGNVVQMFDGTVEIQYLDGSLITVLTPERGSGFFYSSSTSSGNKNTQPIHFNGINDLNTMPKIVHEKFKQLPHVLQQLKNRFGGMTTSTPIQNPVLLSNRFNQMKFIR
ncbi:CLUMA_CG017436, isoform A [Clunio marinus]|uniref:Serine/threonine-protein kinase SAK n=1 Tax=Clunio marinus TaxID=568069 RepID=A0A1J1IVZ4_9DIPT|nr:CLUMA_CG017436, isoform A [Clunio marinus]